MVWNFDCLKHKRISQLVTKIVGLGLESMQRLKLSPDSKYFCNFRNEKMHTLHFNYAYDSFVDIVCNFDINKLVFCADKKCVQIASCLLIKCGKV